MSLLKNANCICLIKRVKNKIIKVESKILRHYDRPLCNELIMQVPLVCVVGYDKKSRITIACPDRFSYMAHLIFLFNCNISLPWRSEWGDRCVCVSNCFSHGQ